MRPQPNPFRCVSHPEAPAAWGCVSCERLLCEECASTRPSPAGLPLPFCSHCGSMAEALGIPGVAEPFARLLGHSVSVPIGWGTAGVLLGSWAIAVVLGRTAGASALGWVAMLAVASVALSVVLSLLLHAAAQGPDRISAEAVESPPPVAWTAVRLLPLTAFVLALPLMSRHGPAWSGGLTSGDAIVLVAGGVLAPWVFMAAALGHPLRTARRLWGLGADTWIAALVSGPALVIAWQFLRAAALIRREESGLLSIFVLLAYAAVPLHLAAIVTLLWLGRLHGLLLFARAVELNYPLAARFKVPVAPDAVPRAQPYLPPVVEAPPVTPIELDPDPEAPPLEVLEAALGARDAKGALAAYAALEPGQRAVLSPSICVLLGKAAASGGEWGVAREVLGRGARVRPGEADPQTATAGVLLARLLMERFSEPQRAYALYRHVADRYPQTEAARFALARLEESSSS